MRRSGPGWSGGPRDRGTRGWPGGPLAGMIPPGFAGHVTLTISGATLTGRADRPGELTGIGPIDPNPLANTWDRYQTGLIAECSDAFMYDRSGIIRV
jgi:hypothetical protein